MIQHRGNNSAAGDTGADPIAPDGASNRQPQDTPKSSPRQDPLVEGLRRQAEEARQRGDYDASCALRLQHGWRMANRRLRITHYALRITDYASRITHHSPGASPC